MHRKAHDWHVAKFEQVCKLNSAITACLYDVPAFSKVYVTDKLIKVNADFTENITLNTSFLIQFENAQKFPKEQMF